ncbi:hypothetical protein PROFUN_11701 [Planoprotostelium fungivorum]|uniref:Protein kinase domain-containing protein n=1 Tax=Planoprotostelium fungivorum TaxID=1890364 RepID=A0A2P6N962_9EUKA|nr:hypothetical protein PROFUN_11701 [Planoprotostelium fungivorum]
MAVVNSLSEVALVFCWVQSLTQAESISGQLTSAVTFQKACRTGYRVHLQKPFTHNKPTQLTAEGNDEAEEAFDLEAPEDATLNAVLASSTEPKTLLTEPMKDSRTRLRIPIRRCEFSSLNETREEENTSRSKDSVEMATPRPRDDSYLSGLPTIDAKRSALAADVRRLTDEEASGPLGFIDSVKAKGPAQLPNQGTPAGEQPLPNSRLIFELNANELKLNANELKLNANELNDPTESSVCLGSETFPGMRFVDQNKTIAELPKYSSPVVRPKAYVTLPPTAREDPEVQGSLFALVKQMTHNHLFAHDTHSSNYPADPVQKPDATITANGGRSTMWCDHQVTLEFKSFLDAGSTVKGLSQLVVRLRAIFRHQPRRRTAYGVLADTTHVIFCRAENTDDYTTFWRTTPMPILSAQGDWSDGGRALMNLLHSTLDVLGCPAPLFHNDGKQHLKCPEGTRFVTVIESIQMIREGTGNQAHLASGTTQYNTNRHMLKFFPHERFDNYQREEAALKRLGEQNPLKLLDSGTWENQGTTFYVIASTPVGIPIRQALRTKLRTATNVVVGDISPNNIIVFNNSAVVVDWESSVDITDSASTEPALIATIPYCSVHIHHAFITQEPITLVAHDDLQAPFYSLIAIAFGEVPWRHSLFAEMETMKQAYSSLDDTWALYCSTRDQELCSIVGGYRK